MHERFSRQRGGGRGEPGGARGACRHLLIALCAILATSVLAFPGPAPAQAQGEGGAELAATCPASVPFGAVFDCSIGAAGEVDTYTFSAAINSRLLISVLRTSGTLDPYARVIKPNGVDEACSRYTYADLISFACDLTLGGAFTLRVADTSGNNTGGYQAYVQRLPAPGSAQALTYGSPTTGSLSSVIQADTRTFIARQNDLINMRMLRTGGTLDPYFSVYDAQGSFVSACSTYTYADLIGASCSITADGTYTVMMGDTGEDNTGTYRFFIQRLNNPGGAAALAYGVPVSAGVGEGAELDVYRFNAQTDDLLMIRLAQSSGSLDPQFQLLDSAGAVVCQSYTYATLAIDDGCAITASGTYALIVDDANNTNTGNYRLYVQRLNRPGNAPAFASGTTLTGSIDGVGAFRSYQIAAGRNSKLDLTMSVTAGALDPYVRIYSSGGLKVCENYTYATTLSIRNCTITADGTYTLIVSDAGNQNVGAYSINLAPILTRRAYLPSITR